MEKEQAYQPICNDKHRRESCRKNIGGKNIKIIQIWHKTLIYMFKKFSRHQVG